MSKVILVTAFLLLTFTLWAESKAPEFFTMKALTVMVILLSALAVLSVVNFWLPS